MKNDSSVTRLSSLRAASSARRLTVAAVSCGLSLVVACSDDEGSDTPINTAGSGGNGGSAGSAGRGGAAGAAGAVGPDGGVSGPRGVVSVLSDDADGLQSPTTAAVRDEDLWVVNGQLGPLFNPDATVNLPFNLVSVPLAGGDIGATDIELEKQTRLRRTEDFKEGVDAVNQRRTPRFAGR